jgi:hypothetical protein
MYDAETSCALKRLRRVRLWVKPGDRKTCTQQVTHHGATHLAQPQKTDALLHLKCPFP